MAVRGKYNGTWGDWAAVYDTGHKPSKSDVGLGNCDNTSDANKPVSTAQAAADTATLNSAKSYVDGKGYDTVTSVNGKI